MLRATPRPTLGPREHFRGSPSNSSEARPCDASSENAPARVLGKFGTVTVLMRSVSKGVTAVAAKQADTALETEREGVGGAERAREERKR